MNNLDVLTDLRKELERSQKQYNDAIFKMIIKGETPSLQDVKTTQDSHYDQQVMELIFLIQQILHAQKEGTTSSLAAICTTDSPALDKLHSNQALESLQLENHQLQEKIEHLKTKEDDYLKRLESQELLMEQSLKQIKELSDQVSSFHSTGIDSRKDDDASLIIHENENLKADNVALQTLLEDLKKENQRHQQSNTEQEAIIFKLNQEVNLLRHQIDASSAMLASSHLEPSNSSSPISLNSSNPTHISSSMNGSFSLNGNGNSSSSHLPMSIGGSGLSTASSTFLTLPSSTIPVVLPDKMIADSTSSVDLSKDEKEAIKFLQQENNTLKFALDELKKEKEECLISISHLNQELAKIKIEFATHSSTPPLSSSQESETATSSGSSHNDEQGEAIIRNLREENAFLRLSLEKSKLETSMVNTQHLKEVTETRETLEQLRQSQDGLKQEKEQLRLSYEQVKLELTQLKELYIQREGEKEELRGKLENFEKIYKKEREELIESLEGKFREKLESSMEETQKRVNDLERQVEDQKNKTQEMVTQVTVAEQKERDLIEIHKETLQKLKDTIRHHEDIIEEKKLKINTLENELHEMKSKNEEISGKLLELSEQVGKLNGWKEKAEEFQGQMAALEDKVKEEEEEYKENLKKFQEDKEKEVAELCKHKEELEEKLKGVKIAKKKLEAAATEWKEKTEKLEGELENSNSQNKKLRGEIKLREEEWGEKEKKYQEDSQKIEKKLKELQEKKSKEEEEKEVEKEKSLKFQSQIEVLETEKKHLNFVLKQQQREIVKLKEQLPQQQHEEISSEISTEEKKNSVAISPTRVKELKTKSVTTPEVVTDTNETATNVNKEKAEAEPVAVPKSVKTKVSPIKPSVKSPVDSVEQSKTKKRRIEEDRDQDNDTATSNNNNSSSSNIKEVNTATPDKRSTPSRGKKGAVVCFSGFKEGDAKYSITFKDKLIGLAQELNIEVRKEADFDSKITHVVTIPNCRTMKTLAAALTQRWLVSPQWIIDSHKAGKLLPEKPYGVRTASSIFENVGVHLSESFRKENSKKEFKIQNCNTLVVQLGKGKIVDDAKGAKYVLVGANDKGSYGGKVLTWNEFIDIIPNGSITAEKVESPSEKEEPENSAISPDKKNVRFNQKKETPSSSQKKKKIQEEEKKEEENKEEEEEVTATPTKRTSKRKQSQSSQSSQENGSSGNKKKKTTSPPVKKTVKPSPTSTTKLKNLSTKKKS